MKNNKTVLLGIFFITVILICVYFIYNNTSLFGGNTDNELACTLSVKCDAILENTDLLDREKLELVPSNGIIFSEREVAFHDGESAFDLLLRELKQNKIHIEYSNTPIYNSVYIEGINNLYEFDCGELSGWTYKVNGQFPNYSSSLYKIKEGDNIEWIYKVN